jgi:hypothetical protein
MPKNTVDSPRDRKPIGKEESYMYAMYLSVVLEMFNIVRTPKH